MKVLNRSLILTLEVKIGLMLQPKVHANKRLQIAQGYVTSHMRIVNICKDFLWKRA